MVGERWRPYLPPRLGTSHPLAQGRRRWAASSSWATLAGPLSPACKKKRRFARPFSNRSGVAGCAVSEAILRGALAVLWLFPSLWVRPSHMARSSGRWTLARSRFCPQRTCRRPASSKTPVTSDRQALASARSHRLSCIRDAEYANSGFVSSGARTMPSKSPRTRRGYGQPGPICHLTH